VQRGEGFAQLLKMIEFEPFWDFLFLRLTLQGNAMTFSSLSHLNSIAMASESPTNTNFDRIVEFSYYDGPEAGLILMDSGEAIRFSYEDDSPRGKFRAYVLEPIPGLWSAGAEFYTQYSHFRFEELSEVQQFEYCRSLEALEIDVRGAKALEQFVGVGTTNLKRLAVQPVTFDQLEELIDRFAINVTYKAFHHFIKEARKSINKGKQ
jgi:hypothetical protein